MSHTDRVKFVEDNIEKVMASAADPMGGEMWWSTAEEPFQALSTCIGISCFSFTCIVISSKNHH